MFFQRMRVCVTEGENDDYKDHSFWKQLTGMYCDIVFVAIFNQCTQLPIAFIIINWLWHDKTILI